MERGQIEKKKMEYPKIFDFLRNVFCLADYHFYGGQQSVCSAFDDGKNCSFNRKYSSAVCTVSGREDGNARSLSA